MATTLNDIAEGKGPEYILITKHSGGYAVMVSGETIQEIIDKLLEIKHSAILANKNK